MIASNNSKLFKDKTNGGNILLIDPGWKSSRNAIPSLSLGYISSFLDFYRFNIYIADFISMDGYVDHYKSENKFINGILNDNQIKDGSDGGVLTATLPQNPRTLQHFL